MSKTKQTCADCNRILRERVAYLTIELPKSRKLCYDCFYKWLDIANPKADNIKEESKDVE